MPADMTKDHFAETVFGKLALIKMGEVPENFRLYEAGWIDDERTLMFVKGCEFRYAKSGINKGKLSIAVEGTERKVYVTSEEMELAKI